MKEKVLITGGAGFIGSHLAHELLKSGYQVKVLDNLIPQVHGKNAKPPSYLSSEVAFIKGDIRDRDILRTALEGVDLVFHLAAMVGVGQSMYQVSNYMDVNDMGTAILLEELIQNPVRKLVVASSMSIYGEGMYKNESGQSVEVEERGKSQLKASSWEITDPEGHPLNPIPTPESKTPTLSSVYALSKYDQERLCLMIGKAYNIPTVALRFFNVYGTNQALSNPYTGVLAIFASRLLNGNPPLVFEDGMQKRDFVHVKDVARACRLAMESPNANHDVFNIGSGASYTIKEIAIKMSEVMGLPYIQPEITGKYRVGDIRHCFADISKAHRILGFTPQISFENGIRELSHWLQDQVAVDNVATMRKELEERGLAI
ncbi:MAG: NAD-dependent epimerase/dehydratase family protein [Candidatus Cyclobacteriaceae bacterium M3_2C_046]